MTASRLLYHSTLGVRAYQGPVKLTNGSKNEQMAPRTNIKWSHEGPSVVESKTEEEEDVYPDALALLF